MRRTKTFAATLFSTAVVALPLMAPSAMAAPAQELPGLTGQTATECNPFVSPLCDLLAQAQELLAPTDPAVPAPVAPVVDALQPVTGPVAEALAPVVPLPTPAPAPTEPTPGPSPAPDGGGRGGTQASSSGGASYFGPVSTTSSGGSATPGRTSSLPKVPSGGTLSLAPLGLPQDAFGRAPFASPTAAADLPLPSLDADPIIETVAAAADVSDDESKATATILALSTLALAAGLLIDQARKARMPIQL